mmetsp:Transcript_17803/g.18551  ORF Transcript_17803/g.18551 Transcript_17803/m.18551 type:complete len:527 (+) Transcript_17803:67-1647(+)
MSKPVVLFLCTHNSCRSQIAEGLAKSFYGNNVIVRSAGSEPANQVNEKAIQVLEEINIDISTQSPKLVVDSLSDIPDEVEIEYLIVLCSSDGQTCPMLPKGRKVKNRIFQYFDDPSQIIPEGVDELYHYRRVRDEIERFISTLTFANNSDGISFFEKYLSVWVLICMIIGSLIGYFVPNSVDVLKNAELFQISIPLAVLLWVMIFPMLLQIDLYAIITAIKNPGPIFLTTFINFGIQPFVMYGISLLFFHHIYKSIITKELADEYLVGCILLGGAPCTAMVFVWSLLVGGNAGYTLMQVAVNDVFLLVFYLPTMLLLLDASSIHLPYKTIAFSIGLFLVAPLILASLFRIYLLQKGGKLLLEKVMNYLKPVTTIGLLSTLILIFVYQGQKIGQKPLDILLIMIPLSIQTFVIFGLTFAFGFLICLDYHVLCPASMISTSNFFELAVAIAISIYGPDSGASLATVVGVLVEVPTMLLLVWICKQSKIFIDKRCESCDEKCPMLRDISQCKKMNRYSVSSMKPELEII